MDTQELAARVAYLEACLKDAGYRETRYGWHNGERFIGLRRHSGWNEPPPHTPEAMLRKQRPNAR